MSKIRLSGSNSGYVEIAAAADAGNLTFVLPTTGTSLFGNGNNVITGITTFSAALDINSSIDVSGASVLNGTTTFNNDVTFDGATAGYDVVWDRSDNQLEFADNTKISFGGSSDLQIYHDGNRSIISDTGTGELRMNGSAIQLRDTAQNFMINATANDSVDLYFNQNKKFETTNTGAIVTGICTATSFSGSGEELTRTTQLSHRNVIINGAAMVAQRGDTTSGATTGGYATDRFQAVQNESGTITISQDSDAPSGFRKCHRLTQTTAQGSLAANDLTTFRYNAEGYDVQRFKKGTSDAEQFTVSFWVKSVDQSSYPVTYILELRDPVNTRSCCKAYTVTASNTWEYKTITFPADTTGQWATDTSKSLEMNWFVCAGSNYTSGTLSTTWAGTVTANRAAGLTANLSANTANRFFLTGVQLEVGEQATPFEHRSFGEELARCQRYFYRVSAAASGTGSHKHIGTMQYYAGANPYGKMLDLPVPMRTIPTGSFTGDIRAWTSGGSNNGSFTTINFDRNDNLFLASNGSTTNQNSGGAGNATPITLYPNSTMSADAEL